MTNPFRRRRETSDSVDIDQLFEDCLDPLPAIEQARPAMTGEEYTEMMLKKTAKKTLDRYRRDEPPPPERSWRTTREQVHEGLADLEVRLGIVDGPPEPIKNCRKCYFASSFRLLGVDWYCLCTNVGRLQAKGQSSWVICKSDLSCWRAP